MSSDLELLFDRLVLMEQAAVTTSSAVPVADYTAETFPFWTNRIDGFAIEWQGEELQIVRYTVVMRLVLALFTEGYVNQAETLMNANIPGIIDYFSKRKQLKRDTSDAALTNLYPQGAEISSGATLYGQLNSPIGANQFGVEFRLEVPYSYEIGQVIY